MLQINSKANAKTILTFDFSTLPHKMLHFDLISVLSSITVFIFKGSQRTDPNVGIIWVHPAFLDLDITLSLKIKTQE